MINKKHLKILVQGVKVWNLWRDKYPDTKPDLVDADLQGMNLQNINFMGADLQRANLCNVNLAGANLTNANLTGTVSIEKRQEHNRSEASINGDMPADYESTDDNDRPWSGEPEDGRPRLDESDASPTTESISPPWSGPPTGYAYEHLYQTADDDSLKTEDTIQPFSSEKYLPHANLCRANMSGADLSKSDLRYADMSSATLINASLYGATLYGVNLRGAYLKGVNMRYARFIDTNLEGARIENCSIYGISSWNLNLKDTFQSDLIITPRGEPSLTVDDLETAQFIYTLLTNEKLRKTIDTITSKVVLILGRFTAEQKDILDGMREGLRKKNYIPVLFDFQKPVSRDITETVSTLAHMARFIIADITNAKSIPQELQRIIPDLPSVPVQPILLASDAEYGMFEHFKRYSWVLETQTYGSKEELLNSLDDKVINAAEEFLKGLNNR